MPEKVSCLGQTISLSHIAPYVRVSREKLNKRFKSYGIKGESLNKIVEKELELEIKDSVQTFNYQVNTLQTSNGQAPFASLAIYLDEEPEYSDELAMLAKEFFIQRMAGMKNENGITTIQTFPKLLYFLDKNNTYEGSKYFELTKLAVKCTSKTMAPDYISVKKMKEIIGYAFPSMGCRAMLSPWYDKNGNAYFYGRGNLGVCTINLPHAALSSKGDINKFWEILDERLEYCKEIGTLRYEKLKGVKASVAPILWQHGALARLNADDDIIKAIDEKGFTVTLGYSGIYETVKYLTGESHSNENGKGFKLAEQIMKHLKEKCNEWKAENPHLRFALYGTPSESTTDYFSRRLIKQFGEIKDVTAHGFVTNSYHIDVREHIDAFEKLRVEAKLQKYSTGGAISYIETYNMQKNPNALLELVQYMYETIIYAEINFEADTCGNCGYKGVMDNDPETLDWVCPNCKCRDQNKLSVIRRVCGYLGETIWVKGRKLDILNRVKHL